MTVRETQLHVMDAANGRLLETAAKGDQRRFEDDDVFRCAIAYLWLRLSEPATQLLSKRLVSPSVAREWSILTSIRNSLAHLPDDEIDYEQLWDLLPTLPMSVGQDVDRLLAG